MKIKQQKSVQQLQQKEYTKIKCAGWKQDSTQMLFLRVSG